MFKSYTPNTVVDQWGVVSKMATLRNPNFAIAAYTDSLYNNRKNHKFCISEFIRCDNTPRLVMTDKLGTKLLPIVYGQ